VTFGNSSDVDAAVIAQLQNDPELAAFGPVVFGLAMKGETKFISIAQIDHDDLYSLGGGITWEAFDYLIEAVEQGSSGTNVKAAANRIRQVLQDALLTPAGYHLRIVEQRTHYVRIPEYDDVTGQYWQRRGGRYEVKVTPIQA
jgi:hypothetical protein